MRYERRTFYICEDIGWLPEWDKWLGLHGIGAVFCRVERDGEISRQAHYFIYGVLLYL